MAVGFVGSNVQANGTTVTIPAGHRNGDLLILYAYRNATGAITIPSPWTELASQNGGTSSYACAWKLCLSSSETSGTWTGAQDLIVICARFQRTNDVPCQVRVGGSTGSTGSTVGYPGGTLFFPQSPQSSRVLYFAACSSDTAGVLDTPPVLPDGSNYSDAGRTGDTVNHNTICAWGSNWNGQHIVDPHGLWTPTQSIAMGVSAESRAIGVELFAELNTFEQFKRFSAGEGLLVGGLG